MGKQNLLFGKSMHIVWIIALCVCYTSCNDDLVVENMSVDNSALVTRAVPTPTMDWENLDWMPTPQGQSQISAPWSGQGSLVPTYGIDIVNDRKASDGWVLLYNTFDASASGPLVNPYFILYNKYRGVMRIYFYVTTSFITASSYIQDGITVNSNFLTSILNFLGQDMVDVTQNVITKYMQMQPAPLDGSLPFVSNRWYMIQYELAYDPNISNIPYEQVQLSWTMNFYNVSKINLGGGVVGKLNGTIGKASDPNFFSALGNVGKTIGEGVIAGVGKDFIEHHTINADTGENTLGLSKSIFKDLSKGISAALSASAGDFPGAFVKLFSAIFGGGTTTTPISFDLRADINLEGTSSEQGGFPSTPTSFWIPGTNISSNASGYIPAYDKVLGVVNFVGTQRPTIKSVEQVREYEAEDPYNGFHYTYTYHTLSFSDNVDCSAWLKINPEVLKVADVTIKKQEVVAYSEGAFLINPGFTWYEGYVEVGAPPFPEPDYTLGVRFTIEVKPKDGSPSAIILKTIVCNQDRKIEFLPS